MKKLFKLLLVILLFVAVLRVLLFEGPVLTPTALPQSGIVDIHCHVACLDEKNGCFVADSLRQNFRFPIYLRAMGTSIEVLKIKGDDVVAENIHRQIMASQYVSKAVILAMDGVVDRTTGLLNRNVTMVYVPNDFVAQQAKKYDTLLFGASVNPYRKDALLRLETVKKQGAVLIKWIPSIMDIDPSDKLLKAFYLKMIELDLPLLTHTGKEKSFTSANDALADPKRLVLPLALGVTVIAAHIATTGGNEGESDFERILPMFRKYPNLYVDISSLTQVNKLGYLNKALQQADIIPHLIYGTDWPLQFFPIVSPWYFALNLSLADIWRLSRIDNTWDRDVALKQALGVPTSVFAAGAKLLKQ